VYTRPIRTNTNDETSSSSSSSGSGHKHKRTSSYFIRRDAHPDLVLRLNHPHQWWTTRKTLNEVLMLNIVKKYTKITVPDVVSWSCEAHTSPFKAEYVLMTHVRTYHSAYSLPHVLVPNK
jgi:hypothetical protein